MRLLATIVAISAAAAPATAQERGFIQGIAGLTFGTDASSVVAGGVIVPVTPTVHIAAEIGRLQNIASNDAREEAERAERRVEESLASSGAPFDIDSDVTSPAFYTMAGARFTAAHGRARPFVGAGAGVARVSPEFRLTFALDGSDITSQAIDVGLLNDDNTTHFLSAAGAGVTIDGPPGVTFEIGYTWMRVFTHHGTNLSRMYGAVGFRF